VIVEVVQNESHTFEFHPDVCPSAAVATAKTASNTVVATGAATVDDAETTIASVSSAQSVVLTDVAGFVRGRRYLLRSVANPDIRALVTLESLTAASKAVVFSEVPHFTPAAGDYLLGVKCTWDLDSSHTTERSTHNRIEWSITDAVSGAVKVHRTYYHVVAQSFDAPVTATEVKTFVARLHPNDARRFGSALCEAIADAANDLVRGKLLAGGRYPHLMGDAGAFRVPGNLALQYVLSEQGIMPAETELAAYQKDLDARLERSITQAVNACWYDQDDSQSAEDAEKPQRRVMLVVR